MASGGAGTGAERLERSRRGLELDPHDRPARYLTGDVPAVGGRIKSRPEDFLVEEIPLYQPAGEGEHLYLFIEKRELTTLEVVGILAKHFRVGRRSIGFAGLKDKRAITRQVFSIHLPGTDLEGLPALEHPRLGVLWADRHRNKLRRGHLAGNRFSIRIREVSPTAVVPAKRVLDRLEAEGAPNRVGEQRFGYMRSNHLIGRAIALGDAQAAVDALLGPAWDPAVAAADQQAEAREAYLAGELERSLELFSPRLKSERRALGALLEGKGPEGAVAALDRTVVGYFLSALQSAVFNALLDERLEAGTLGVLEEGDVAFVHATRGRFPVRGRAGEPELQEEVRRLEVSPSGPMWGPSMLRAEGEAGQREARALARLGLEPGDLEGFESAGVSLEGDRRPLRVPVRDPIVEGGVDEVGPFVRCAFELPRGAFATVVLEEVMKRGRGE